MTDCSGISCETALIWRSLDFTNDQSTLVQVMDWCRQATSHYLNQCWPRSPTPYGVTMPQWVNSLDPGRFSCNHKRVIFKLISRMDILHISGEITLKWMLRDVTDAESSLIQVMAWCHQASSHCQNQCRPSSTMPYGIIKPWRGVKCWIFQQT